MAQPTTTAGLIAQQQALEVQIAALALPASEEMIAHLKAASPAPCAALLDQLPDVSLRLITDFIQIHANTVAHFEREVVRLAALLDAAS